MLELMVGLKGSGKTKTLIEKANEATKTTDGSVAVIEQNRKLINEIDTGARLVETEEYDVTSAYSLYGFTVGMFASNYDIKYIFIDSALKIVGNDIPSFSEMIKTLDRFAQKQNINIFITSSVEVKDLPDDIKSYVVNV